MPSDKELKKAAEHRVRETNAAVQQYIDQHDDVDDEELLRDPKLRSLEAEARLAERALEQQSERKR